MDLLLTFTQIGINGFGCLGRAVFCKACGLISTVRLIEETTNN